jgi:hypothetical protein
MFFSDHFLKISNLQGVLSNFPILNKSNNFAILDESGSVVGDFDNVHFLSLFLSSLFLISALYQKFFRGQY